MDGIINYTKGNGLNKNWLIEETDFDERYTGKCEAIFCQGNGYLGLRNALEERYLNEKRNMFVAGTFNKASSGEVTELPNIPDITNMEIEINGCRFSMVSGQIRDYSRTINLHTGETIRCLTWQSTKNDSVKFKFRRFVSGDNLHLICNCVEIMPQSKDVCVRIVSGIDGQVTNSGAQHFTELSKRVFGEKYLEMISQTTESDVIVSVHSAHRALCNGKEFKYSDSRIIDERRKISSNMTISVKVDDVVRIEKISVVHTSRDQEYEGVTGEKMIEVLKEDGLSLLGTALESGYDSLLIDSTYIWEKFWNDQDIRIDSDNDFDQLAVRFALYHLQIMTKKGDNRIGIGAKGLSGEGYKGHSFWDTETFIFPYFQMAQPEVARTLLEYRYLGLYGARIKAKTQGFNGAMYPWESAWISDGEVTPWLIGANIHTGEPLYCLTGTKEIHITADIIYALWQYYLATNDNDFMCKYGYEMIIETAVFWSSRLEWIEEKERYEIRDVIGPDEYKENIDNNAYTNYMAKFNMELAVYAIELLTSQEKDVYQRLSKLVNLETLKVELRDKLQKFYLPLPDERTGIIPQFDGYFDLKNIELKKYKEASVVGTIYNDYSIDDVQHMKAGKQADIVELLYQMEDLVNNDIRKKNYCYYEARTLHDSSLSKAIHSILASDLEMPGEAYEMFVKAASTDLGQEMRSSDSGIHSANMGGIWQDVVMGFGGVRIRKDKLRIAPHLPQGWKKLKFPIYWKGNRQMVCVENHKLTIINEGEEIMLIIMDKEVCAHKGENIFYL